MHALFVFVKCLWCAITSSLWLHVVYRRSVIFVIYHHQSFLQSTLSEVTGVWSHALITVFENVIVTRASLEA